jgi:hypothetical protein
MARENRFLHMKGGFKREPDIWQALLERKCGKFVMRTVADSGTRTGLNDYPYEEYGSYRHRC